MLLGVAWALAFVLGAAVVKGRVVFVPGRLWMLSCRSECRLHC